MEASVAVLGGHLALWQAPAFARRLRAYAPDALLISTFKKVWLGGWAGRRAGCRRSSPASASTRICPESTGPTAWRSAAGWTPCSSTPTASAAPWWRGSRTTPPSGSPPSTTASRLPPPDWTPSDARRTLGLPLDAPVVGAVTRLSAQKRIDRMIELLPLLPGVHLALAGRGELEERPAGAGPGARRGGPHALPRLPGRRGPRARGAGRLPLTSDKEGMANAMLEAMAAGVPVVSTPVSGADEALYADREGRAPGRVVEADVREPRRGGPRASWSSPRCASPWRKRVAAAPGSASRSMRCSTRGRPCSAATRRRPGTEARRAPVRPSGPPRRRTV